MAKKFTYDYESSIVVFTRGKAKLPHAKVKSGSELVGDATTVEWLHSVVHSAGVNQQGLPSESSVCVCEELQGASKCKWTR